MANELKLSEYEALRATIRERGSVRMWVILVGVSAWGLLTLLMTIPSFSFERAPILVPLLVLIATFELSFFIHTGVERVGRYLQVYYDDQWEETAMLYGRSYPGGLDPIFTRLFTILAIVNFGAAIPNAMQRIAWVPILFAAHVLFAWRLLSARQMAAAQRPLDLERFRALKNAEMSSK